jgi:hypothetical protein
MPKVKPWTSVEKYEEFSVSDEFEKMAEAHWKWYSKYYRAELRYREACCKNPDNYSKHQKMLQGLIDLKAEEPINPEDYMPTKSAYAKYYAKEAKKITGPWEGPDQKLLEECYSDY